MPLLCAALLLDLTELHIVASSSSVLEGPEGWTNIVITGGFTDDDGVVVVSVPPTRAHERAWGWDMLTPIDGATFVYGASLTALPPSPAAYAPALSESGSGPSAVKVHECRAVRFGGFRSGGYSNETNEVWVLTIRDVEYDDGGLSTDATWRRIETTGDKVAPRAYHSATLVHDRYLVIIGGMTSQGSTVEEAILDVKTWTWHDISLACKGEPTGRHGHSVVWDDRRDRLVLFGGGSGSDLLRSGVDNDQVWELKMGGIKLPLPSDAEKMWQWHKLYGETVSDDDDDVSDDGSRDDDQPMDEEEADGKMSHGNSTEALSPSESLCLGRCHNGMKIAPDTVLLIFGGGPVNTNGVLGYDLRRDVFIRPKVSGPLPMPRFTGIASFLNAPGYVFVHGGYNSQVADSIQGLTLLDVAPYLNRNFTALPIDANRRSHDTVSDIEVQNSRMGNVGNEGLGAYFAQYIAWRLAQGE